VELVGLTDIAEKLKVSRQRVLQLRRREDFPEPVGEIANGAVWDMDQIRAWARSAVRPAGRPKAEELARTMGNRFVLDENPMHIGPRTRVYRALDRRFGAPAAVKLIDLNGVNSEESRTFELGLRALESTAHPNLLQVLAHGLAPDGRKWVATPLATGSLEDFLTNVRRSPGATADLMRQLCAGLGSIHISGISHGDIKPQNVLRGEDGAWVLADFCMPAVLAVLDFGGKNYRAPELSEPHGIPSVRSDVFSLGRLLDFLSPAGTPHRHIFQDVINRSTVLEANERFGSVSAFVRAINEALSATQEFTFWASPTSAADDLQERARGAGTSPEDLYRILEWAERLHSADPEDMHALARVFPWLSDRAILTLTGQNLTLFEQVFSTFGSFVGSESFPPEYCDRFAEFVKRTVALTSSESVFGSGLRCLALLGFRNKQWSVRDIFVELLTHLQGEALATTAVLALAPLDDEIFDWNLTEFALRALPSSIRLPLVASRHSPQAEPEDKPISTPTPARPYRRTSN
jgi:serine/threonine protein kinase